MKGQKQRGIGGGGRIRRGEVRGMGSKEEEGVVGRVMGKRYAGEEEGGRWVHEGEEDW